jgi:dienelactone hydrolase
VTACLVAAIGLATAGAAGLVRAGSGTVARPVTVDGVPLLEVSPAAPGNGRPGAVIAHGFSGSARLMRGFADTLAAQGYVAVLPDFAGHGRNTTGLPPLDDRAADDALQRDLAAAVRHLRALPTVDPSRIVLVGHSMGAAAVAAYAVEHPDIRATVAISIGSAGDLPDDPARPRNLLLIVGAAEFPPFHDAALAALRRGYPALSYGQTAGEPATGTARRAVRVAGVEHISVLYATRTHAESVTWLGRAVAAPVGGQLHPRDRLVPAGVLLLAFLLGFVPLTVALLPRRAGAAGAAAPPGRVRTRYAYGGLVAALTLGVLLAGVAPTNLLPLAVGGYAAGFFAITGAGLVAAYALDRRPALNPAPGTGWRQAGWRQAGAAAVLTAYAVTAAAVPMHLGLTHAVPVGARWWLLPIVVGCVALLLVGSELLAGDTRWRQPLILAATAAAVLIATLAGLAPRFVLLVLPLLVILFAWHAGWSAVLRRRSAPVWLPALVGATVVGWPIAMSLPLT